MSHLGRHRNDLATWRAYAASAGETVAELVGAWDGWQPRELDLGGGYAAPRDPNTWVYGGDIAQPLAPAVEDVVEALASGLRAGLAGRVPLAGVALEIEPGRVAARRHGHPPHARRQPQAAARAAGLALGRDRHDRDVPARPARGALPLPGRGRRRAWASRPRSRSTWSAARAASTCWRTRCGCPPVELGDTLAFLDTGAYEDACAANFNALPRPAIVLVSGTEAEVVRRAETIEDVFARDVVPERLRP